MGRRVRCFFASVYLLTEAAQHMDIETTLKTASDRHAIHVIRDWLS